MDMNMDTTKLDEIVATPDLVEPVAVMGLGKHSEVETKPPEIRCGTCNEKFTQGTALKIHEMFHSEKSYCTVCRTNIRKNFHKHIRDRHMNHICKTCNKVFPLRKTLDIHHRSHTKEKIFKCNKCDKSFMQKGTLSTHIKSFHQGIKPYACKICQGTFTTSSSLKTHLRKMHTKSTYECYICYEQFSDKKRKFDHEREHIKSRECEFCGKKFAKPGHFSRHLILMHFKTEKCMYCKKMFHKSILDAHMAEKHKPRECYICRLKFYSARGLTNHLTSHRVKITCKLCNRSYVEANREKHLQLHRENKIQKCKRCNKRFVGVHSLKRHIDVKHCPLRPYKCLICKRGFKYLHGLEKHTARHDDKKEYKFQCTICEIKYWNEYYLNKHLIMCHSPTVVTKDNDELEKATIRKINFLQSNRRNFQCKKCQALFKYYDSFKKHFCTTHNAQGFNCSLCHQRYRMKRDLVEHLEEKHPDNHLKCSICGCMFINKSCLRLHIRMHMKNEHKKSAIENESKTIFEEEMKIVLEDVKLENKVTENESNSIPAEEIKFVEEIKTENVDTTCTQEENNILIKKDFSDNDHL